MVFLLDWRYQYTDQLLYLEQDGVKHELESNLPEPLGRVVTLLKVEAWKTYLTNHPDRAFVDYLLRGIRLGFRIGCKSQASLLKSSKANMVSTIQHPQVVSEYTEKEVQANHMYLVGAAHDDLAKKIHCGVIPKMNKPNKWRLILDL